MYIHTYHMYICTCEGINVHITYTLQVANSCGHIYLKRARLYCIITCAQGNIKKLSQILTGFNFFVQPIEQERL